MEILTVVLLGIIAVLLYDIQHFLRTIIKQLDTYLGNDEGKSASLKYTVGEIYKQLVKGK